MCKDCRWVSPPRRDNPRIALAYGAAFMGRSDLVVVIIFLSLWITQSGVAKGMTTSDAFVQAGVMIGILQLSALLFAPVIGYLIDKINRVAAVALAMFIAMVGYTWVGLLDVPIGAAAYPAMIVLGMGQVSRDRGGNRARRSGIHEGNDGRHQRRIQCVRCDRHPDGYQGRRLVVRCLDAGCTVYRDRRAECLVLIAAWHDLGRMMCGQSAQQTSAE